MIAGRPPRRITYRSAPRMGRAVQAVLALQRSAPAGDGGKLCARGGLEYVDRINSKEYIMACGINRQRNYYHCRKHIVASTLRAFTCCVVSGQEMPSVTEVSMCVQSLLVRKLGIRSFLSLTRRHLTFLLRRFTSNTVIR